MVVAGIYLGPGLAGEVAGSTWAVDPSDSWQRNCTSWFFVPTDDNELQFGVQAFVPSADGAWLVDDVDVISESIFSDGFESGNLSRWSNVEGP